MTSLQHGHPPHQLNGTAFKVIVLLWACLSMSVNAEIKSIDGLEINRVILMGHNELEVTQADTTHLKIRADEKNIAKSFSVEDKTLRLGVNSEGQQVHQVKYKLSVNFIRSILVQGSGKAFLNPWRQDQLRVALQGSGVIKMRKLDIDQLELLLAGSGNIEAIEVKSAKALLHLKGSGDIELGRLNAELIMTNMKGSGELIINERSSVDRLEVQLIGSGDVDLSQLQSTTAQVNIMGSGDVEIWAKDKLVAEIFGSGDVIYQGEPAISSSVHGSGNLKHHNQ